MWTDSTRTRSHRSRAEKTGAANRVRVVEIYLVGREDKPEILSSVISDHSRMGEFMTPGFASSSTHEQMPLQLASSERCHAPFLKLLLDFLLEPATLLQVGLLTLRNPFPSLEDKQLYSMRLTSTFLQRSHGLFRSGAAVFQKLAYDYRVFSVSIQV